MRVSAIGIELAHGVAIDRPKGRDTRELDREATFGRACYQLRCCEDDRRAEVHNSLAQRRQYPKTQRNSATEPGFKRARADSFLSWPANQFPNQRARNASTA
jgi:hypothetical protein